MTPQAIQRFVVRMAWDPALVERVYAGAPVEGLDAAGRAMLTRVDRRAWDTDPYRRARTLQPLIEEFPASVAEVGVAGLEAFFGDRAFHDAIAHRGSIGMAFGAWIAPRAGPVAEIERAFAGLRRAREAARPARSVGRGPVRPGEVARSPEVTPLEVPEGTLARWEATLRALGSPPLPKLAAGWRAPPASWGKAKEHLLVRVRGERHAPGEGAEEVIPGSDGLHALLVKAARPLDRKDLRRVAVRLGATPAEADEVIAGLVADGLLIAG